MKALLEFDMSDPEDKMAHMRAVKALDMAIFIFEITHNMRSRVEHMVDVYPTECTPYRAIDLMMQEIESELESCGININELIT